MDTIEKKRCEYELFVEKYFGLPANINPNAPTVGLTYSDLVSLLSSYQTHCLPLIEEVKRLRDQLDAAKLALKEIYTGTPFPLSIAQNALQLLSTTSKVDDDGWIRVEDRLPELPPPYWEDGYKMKPITDIAIVYNGEDVYQEFYDKNGFKDKEITHWRYLPTPPKQ